MLEEPYYGVEGYVGSCMAQMGHVLDGRPHTYIFTFLDGWLLIFLNLLQKLPGGIHDDRNS
ncbi:MAG: hypothetical protein B9J98_01950 [Candidatus Terraquivivens tikiterensis]|uniref:Uncharacterized protein n=1 Tax=Candidatus Terraquivivens tikiterensis TaxID=1980982 RepID=A0A2R7YA39_9ARCH|nr:MAG: hypothetical protein B9J98_01950 [Candidatus Terraquivivens tikiterensis]